MVRTVVISLLLAVVLAGCESSSSSDSANSTQQAPKPALSPQARQNDPVYAYVDTVRNELSDGKVQIINRVMRLSSDESKVFWPIYRDYEEELFDLGDQRVELSRNFV